MATNKTILIATNSIDLPSVEKVVQHLQHEGYSVISYYADKVSSGACELSLHIESDGTRSFSYDGKAFSPADIKAAWYRRPNYFGEYKDTLRELSMAEEYKMSQNNLWGAIANDAWLNAPAAMRAADIKLSQLEVAASLGFNIPETVISNSWKSVKQISDEKIIVKMHDGVLRSRDETKVAFTTVFKNDRESLPGKDVLPYPGIWQSYKQKKREWRVTVVGDEVFSAAVYTETNAKDDWRKHQAKSVTFKAEDFPQELQKKCIEFLKHFKLRYGAFDFIETPNSEIVFLEVNPNGQYMWLEEELGLPISKAIASELANKALK